MSAIAWHSRNEVYHLKIKAMLFPQVGPRCRLTSCDPGLKCNETCNNPQGYECIGKFLIFIMINNLYGVVTQFTG